MSAPAPFAARLLAWWEAHGRKDLPWQRERTPYRVWISEVMLQQTQVATVIPYFERFMARFPDAATLAAAPLDDVLHHWSGLGYYSRARHLHRAAQALADSHAGALPRTHAALVALPGIGRSTASAILAQAHDARHVILDGNVKRVIARHAGVAGWPGAPAVERALWAQAERRTPAARAADYTQAIMDLGATLCTRARPRCDDCPVGADCVARREGRQRELPGARPPRTLPVRRTCFLIVRDARGAVLLERRPPSGVWGGLWGFPECAPGEDAAGACLARHGLVARATATWPVLRHTFSHFHLDITPCVLALTGAGPRVLEGAGTLWYNSDAAAAVGLAAPVAALLLRLHEEGAGEPG